MHQGYPASAGGCDKCGVCGIHGSGYPSFEYVRCEGTRGKGAPAWYLQGIRSRELKKGLTGRVIRINLEPVGGIRRRLRMQELCGEMTPGRKATVENAGTACEMGVQLLVLTGNPGSRVSNKAITDSLRYFRRPG